VRVGGQRHAGERGVVAAEFIILFPIFFTLVVGMVWAGTMLFRWMNLEVSAREGARYAAILPTGYDDDIDKSGTPSSEWFDAVFDRVESRSLMGPSTICVAYVGLLGNEEAEEANTTTSISYVRQPNGSTAPGGGTCFADNRGATIRRVQVDVTGPVPLQGFGFWSGTLRGNATARFEAVYPRE
jgi:hypothetical protein